MAVKVLSITSKGFSGVYTNLWKVLRNNVVRELRESVDESVGDLALVAQEMAPFRSGKLEEAIQVAPGRRSFDSGLSYVRSIWIRPTVYNKYAHRRVGEYAEYIHENLTPAGNLNLGPLSQIKDSVSKYQVGGHFMTRAFEEMKPFIFKKITQALDEALRKI